MLFPSWNRSHLQLLFPLLAALLGAVAPVSAQLPTPEQVEATLANQPALAQRLRDRISSSGLTNDQIRARLRAAGYPENMLDQYLTGADSTTASNPGSGTLDAVRALGIVSEQEADSLRVLTDSARLVADSLRRDSLRVRRDTGLQVFGLSLFERASNQFQPTQNGPVDPEYRLGPGDELVLILTGDVELSYDAVVTREGFIAIPQVGQISVSNLTLEQLNQLLYTRLGKVYSGVKRGPGATTKFSVSVGRLRTIQVFVVGDVVWPGAYQVAGSGTAMTALYAAGGPTFRGSFRRIEVRRAGTLLDSLDLYDYLLRGDASHDVRLENGDVVFVPVRQNQVSVVGKIVRPAIYELLSGETLRDLIHTAGGFEAAALRRRVQINRILAPAQRELGGRDRVVIDLASEQFVDGEGPAFPMAAGDSVTVFAVADRRRDMVTVTGAVWTPGTVGFTSGMKLSDAIRLAGGPKSEVYLGQVLVSRLQPDSTRIQLRSSFQDSTGTLSDDLSLREDDEITVFSRSSFRPDRYIAITGAVRKPGQLPYRDGITLRDAVLQASGLTEDADLRQAEIARLPSEEDREQGRVATTVRVPLDSTYIFERRSDERYLGPPGIPVNAAGAAEVPLSPYDNVLILRQPQWELQRTVVINGAVTFPGRYSLVTRTDRLTDLIQRAGGLTRESYPLGITFYRSIDRGGRIGVDLPRVLKDPKFRDNLILAGGDSVFIPEYNPVVYVRGAVNAPVSVAYTPGKTLDYYLAAAGGTSRTADKGRAYVTQPSGKVESVKRRFLLADGKPKPQAGGVVYVPEKDPNDKKDWVGMVSAVTGILASLTTIIIVLTR